ncbi:hypothetical protein [Candidatus Nanohalovita haloferacivicina]|uniref:hypothetical protein n=1 Tax=Candidatus Nanohalovita haloferacivicina TaxID=2978046 RepID=UPI00325F9E91|nr:UDP-N-acetylglucosamine--dolichyl-phosphate N-acetylglucosaminephosphotransferase [Candidatus Nanohalobia archaeon BNXNv]
MIYLVASLAAGFLVTFLGVPFARKYLFSSGIYGVDQQKEDRPRLPTSGGVTVFFGFLVSMTLYLGLISFMSAPPVDVSLLLAALSSVSIIALIGFIDDIHIRIDEYVKEEYEIDIEIDESGEEKERHIEFDLPLIDDIAKGTEVHREGLSQIPKMLFVLPAVFPLMAVRAGSWSMNFPLIGTIEWGIIYPLVLLPLGLLFVSNVVNMLAGTNGLSTGMSMIAAFGLGVMGYLSGSVEAQVIAFSLAVSLAAFFYYNFYPASVLPGDSLTYLSGAALFSVIVIGNMEKFGVFIFAPWILEFLLKLRSGFNAASWGELVDGELRPKYEKNYSLTHPLMRRGLGEKEITLVLMAVEAVIVVVGLVLFGVYGVL